MTASTTLKSVSGKVRVDNHTQCYHCSEPLPTTPIPFDEKKFCCEGCRTVYEILNTNRMCQYYAIDETAGISLRGKRREEYAFLDDPEVLKRLVQFSDGKTTRITLFLPQIHCASCIWLLENLFQLSDGIHGQLGGFDFFLLIGKWFQQRTYHHISFERDYKSYFPISARKKEGGIEQSVALDKLDAGNIILVRNGKLIPPTPSCCGEKPISITVL